MSHLLEQLEGRERRAECEKHEVRYGCHIDLGPDEKPDGCVFDSGDIDDCRIASKLAESGLGKMDCAEWKPIRISVPGDSYATLAASHQRLKEALQAILNDGVHCDVVPHLHRQAREALRSAP
jgi:hypothetical protein